MVYIRTKDNKLVDNTEARYPIGKITAIYNKKYYPGIKVGDIVVAINFEDHAISRQSDAVQNLIESDDLIKTTYGVLYEVYGVDGDWILVEEGRIRVEKATVKELYFKQENDYVLVWTREKGVITK